MSRITNAFLDLLGINSGDEIVWRPAKNYKISTSAIALGLFPEPTPTSPFPLLAGLAESFLVHREIGNAANRYELILQNTECLREHLRKIPKLRLLDEQGGSSPFRTRVVSALQSIILVAKKLTDLLAY